jgi:hypothetical protein
MRQHTSFFYPPDVPMGQGPAFVNQPLTCAPSTSDRIYTRFLGETTYDRFFTIPCKKHLFYFSVLTPPPEFLIGYPFAKNQDFFSFESLFNQVIKFHKSWQ